MAKIGSYAGLAFEVKDKKVLTFSDFSMETSPRWDTHDIWLKKPIPEFRGPGLDEISFIIKLRADLGVNPEKQMKKLRDFAAKGKASQFIKGNKPISPNYWAIKKISETHKSIDNKGNTLSIEAELTLMEYPKTKVATKKKKKKTTNKSSSSGKKSSLKKTGTITITVKSVHIRSGPGVKYKVLGYAFRNQKLTVYGKKNGWYYLGSGKYITGSTKYSKFKKG